MRWLKQSGLVRRAVAVVDDQVGDLDDMMEGVAASAQREELMANLTWVCLGDPGSDADSYFKRWLQDNPTIQIAAATKLNDDRILDISGPRGSPVSLAGRLLDFIYPTGLLLIDLKLQETPFYSEPATWEASIGLASQCRGAESGIRCLFMSRHDFPLDMSRRFEQFGWKFREDSIPKEPWSDVIGKIWEHLRDRFQCRLEVKGRSDSIRLPCSQETRASVSREFDIVLCELESAYEITGRALRRVVTFPSLNQKSRIWKRLILAALDGEDPLSVEGLALAMRGRPPDLALERSVREPDRNQVAKNLLKIRRDLKKDAYLKTEGKVRRLGEDLTIARILWEPLS